MKRRTACPPPAVDWMVPGAAQRVLDVGSGRGALAAQLVDAGHTVHCLDSDHARVRRLRDRLPEACVTVARAEALPYDSCHFDVVTVHESFTNFAPGLALAEFARVLRPGGHLAVVFDSRDDTVPWVKRLARRLQEVDPTAMRGDYGTETIVALTSSAYFPDVEQKAFRNWIPIDRDGMLAMVANRPAIARADASERESLLADVEELYAASSRPPEPLLLPFQAMCWRAYVDHTELTQPVTEESLRISLRF
ncbi:class I SAM-dependent methyltransferase [Mariniluteicoccus flavus]